VFLLLIQSIGTLTLNISYVFTCNFLLFCFFLKWIELLFLLLVPFIIIISISSGSSSSIYCSSSRCSIWNVFLTFCGRLSGQPRHSSVVKQVDCRGSPAKCLILASRREWQFPAI
jgi:hypothetical protein